MAAEPDKQEGEKVLVWDLDETLIVFQTLTTGRFAQLFQGAKDARVSVRLGRRWEKLIIQVCDDYFFYQQVEDFNKPTLEAWRMYDDGRDLSSYNFDSDGLIVISDGLSETEDEANNRKLAYRHRWISNLYVQGLEGLLNEEQNQEWQELYELTDAFTDGWLTAGRTILQRCVEASRSDLSEAAGNGSSWPGCMNTLVTSGSLVPSLVKLLLFKLDTFFSHENVYSSTEVGKLECFKWIRQRFNYPRMKFCVIGDGIDECEAAQALQWPFVKIDTPPYGHLRLPALSVGIIDSYMKVVYGDDESPS